MGEDDKKRAEEYQKALDADDAEDVAKGKLFDPRELLFEAKAMRQKYHKRLGLVNFSVLTFDEMLGLGKVVDKDERSKTMLWMMLNKAYPDLSKEDIGRFPGTKVADLLTLVTEGGDFLPAASKHLKSGSKTTRTRK
ncbi:hypothetical protein MUP79_04895 [Candidatus Bathyarchaeota archaeon]|nr:hypothetical protein [Candidatus Bathyarchaeota archaeon]